MKKKKRFCIKEWGLRWGLGAEVMVSPARPIPWDAQLKLATASLSELVIHWI